MRLDAKGLVLTTDDMEGIDMDPNEELHKALFGENRDLKKMQALLQSGADPLFRRKDEPIYESILEEFISECMYSEKEIIDEDQIIQMFFDNGMVFREYADNPEHPVIPFSDLALIRDERGIRMLKVFLDNNVECDCIECVPDHILMDMAYVDCCCFDNPQWVSETYYGLKMVMLVASYEKYIQESEYLKQWIDYEHNDPQKLVLFRDWNSLEYSIDLSTATNIEYGLLNATVTITEKATGKSVWTMKVI